MLELMRRGRRLVFALKEKGLRRPPWHSPLARCLVFALKEKGLRSSLGRATRLLGLVFALKEKGLRPQSASRFPLAV